jgi:hypothetical protein
VEEVEVLEERRVVVPERVVETVGMEVEVEVRIHRLVLVDKDLLSFNMFLLIT